MFTDFLKRNSILLFFSVLWLLIIGLVMYELDKQHYQVAKRSLIAEDIRWGRSKELLDEEALADLTRLTLEALRQNRLQTDTRLKDKILEILRGPSVIWRIAIRPEAPQPVKGQGQGTAPAPKVWTMPIDMARPEKLREFNSFSNSLFFRDFSSPADQPIGADELGNPLGRLIIHYTTPRDNPQIQELTTQYRWYAVFIAVILALMASVVARTVLFPVRNVMNSIDRSTGERTIFVHRPHSRLETLYNRMALDAVLARLQGLLRDEIAHHPQMTGWEVVGFGCRAFGEQIGLPLVGCMELVAEGPGRIRATGPKITAGGVPWELTGEELAEVIAHLAARDGRTETRFSITDTDPPVDGVLELVADPERAGIRYLFALALDARQSEGSYVSLPHMLQSLTDLVGAGLQSLSTRNQLLMQERGRANISLSRNLGHDLTNIIATSKLELMALDRLLGNGMPPEDPRRRVILTESLHGLLRSVRFMQETVNLYRAYAFLQHPILEAHDGNALVGEALDLFAMSSSSKVDLRRDLAEDAPRCVVDPRLIKLALFNLFSNALEALRKTDEARTERTGTGWIRAVTRRSAAGGLYIAVEDSGTGILNRDGERAEPHEIEKIFELGYTSRRAGGGQGEGLGLNWVRTIVQDLHGGTISAENTADAGARIILVFPA